MNPLKTIALLIILLSSAFLGLGALTSTPKPLKQKSDNLPIYIHNVAIVDVISGRILQGQHVLIDDGRILDISAVELSPEGAVHVSIDGRNKFLMPALWDMHVHTIKNSDLLHFPLYIANGVLNVRDLGNTCSWSSSQGCMAPNSDWQALVEKKALLGPMQWGQVSYHMEELEGSDISAALKSLRDSKDDLLKLQLSHETTTEQFQSILDQAKNAGIPAAGHLPGNLKLDELNLSNLNSIEHDRAFYSYCGNAKIDFEERVSVMTTHTNSFDEAQCASIMQGLKSQGISYTPTHIASSVQDINIVKPRDEAKPYNKYIDAITLGLWHTYAWLTNLGFDENDKASFQKLKEASFRISKLAQDNDVLLLAGTDASDAYIYPGFSLYDELALLSQAGLSNIEVIRTATINPAKHVKAEALLGSVSVGKRADLILLNSNPLEELSALTQIDAVISKGEHYDKAELEDMKQYTADVARDSTVTAKRLWQLLFE